MNKLSKGIIEEINSLVSGSLSPVLIAVSGGVDSMLLWHFFYEAGIAHEIAHVNFQLRGNESDLDEELVRTLAEKRKVKAHFLKADTKTFLNENGISIQMAAREIRYNWFKELMKKRKIKQLATAHHANDSIETFFINLDRGTGVLGLDGINNEKELIRPFLMMFKSEIMALAKELNIAYREDLSNRKNDYRRNWFRNELLPQWKSQNPAIEKIMLRNLKVIARQNEVYQSAIREDVSSGNDELKRGKLSYATIQDLKYGIDALYNLLAEFGFNFSQVEQMFSSISKGDSGKVFYSSQKAIYTDRNQLIIRELNEITENSLDLSFRFLPNENIDLIQQPNRAFFDADLIQLPIEIRIWEEGDFIVPLGMKGKKKVSDILIDKKIPLADKNQVKVLVSNDKLIAVCGLVVGEYFKVKENTSTICEVIWQI